MSSPNIENTVVSADFIRGFEKGATVDDLPKVVEMSQQWLRGYHAGIVARDRAIEIEHLRLKADERAARGPPITPGRALDTLSKARNGELKR